MDTAKLEKFITENKVRLSCTWISARPDNLMSPDMDHWKCILSANKRKYTFYYSQGYGHDGAEPKLTDVLDCLASTKDFADFEDFCEEYVYDTDSRKAERIYKAVCKEKAAMLRLFGPEKLEELQDILFA